MTQRDQERRERDERWRRWMASAQGGDRPSYERLLTELLPVVRQIVRRRMGERPAAEDVVQEVLLSIHTARHTYHPERPLLPWVRAIARNAVVDWSRRHARTQGREVDLDAVPLPAAEERPAERLLSKALSPALQRALEALPEPQRQAVLLLKIEGMSVQEAARHAGVSPGALKLRAHRGYRTLRGLLRGEPS